MAKTGVMASLAIKPAFGEFLLGRPIGAKIREQHFSGPDENWPTEVDFSDVKQATESCLDEIFGVLARRVGPERVLRIRLRNASGEVKDAVEYVRDLIRDSPDTPTWLQIEKILGRRSRKAG